MQFTEAQQKAIETKNCSLLIAAGAGSGKTRVLTERIIDRILDTENNTNITDFLIVTFTKAAAEEMSNRIRKALTERSRLYPENKKLIRNIALLPQARISTISSFCLDLIKENYQKLGLSPKLRIAEEDEIGMMLDRIADRIIEKKLSEPENHPYFLTLYETFSGKKSDAGFSESIKSFYKSLTNMPSMKKYLDDVCERYKEFSEADELFDTFFGKLIKDITKKDLNSARELLFFAYNKSKEEPHTQKLLADVLENDIVAIDNILSSLDAGYEATLQTVNAFAPARKPTDRNSETKDFTDSVWISAAAGRDIVKSDIRSSFYNINSDIYRKCARDYFNLSKELSDIALEIDKELDTEKKANGIVSFSDVERYTLELLYDDLENGITSDTALSVAQGIKELYIDEYQDINPIQDMIFKALSAKSADGYEKNRFMVGDSKQSIYGFRGARPDIFNGYRKTFSDLECDDAPRRKIFMQNNFRCAESVIDFTNMLFDKIMPEDYTESDKLIFSKVSDNKIQAPVKMLFYNTFSEKLSSEMCQVTEAEQLLEEIKKIVRNPECLSSAGKMYTLNDITILTRTWNEASLLEKFFTEKRIPVICERGENFFERDEVKLALNIIRSTDNPERNICTAGFMRSAVCGFTDDELALIRKNQQTSSLFSAAKKYLMCDGADKNTISKINRFLELHGHLRKLARSCSAHEFVSKMYSVTDLINICTSPSYSTLENDAARIRKKNLTKLYDLSRDFDKTVFKGISAFLEYIDSKINSGDKKKSATISSEGIHIMTVHKSKGLEFPVCFIYGAEKDSPGISDKIVMNDNAGFSFKLKSLEKTESVKGVHGFAVTDTPFRQLIKRMCAETEETEAKRLLYVGLTRACDLLYITACPKAVKDYEKNIKGLKSYKLTKGKNPLEQILSFIYTVNSDFSVESPGSFDICSENGRTALTVTVKMCLPEEKAEAVQNDNAEKTEYQPDFVLLDKIKAKISASETAKKKLNTIPPKLTVSLLKHGLIDYEETENSAESQRNPLEMPEFIRETAAKTGAEKGTAMHTFLQFADFSACESGSCTQEADRLRENGFITAKQHSMLDIEKLDNFFKTPLYAHIKSAKAVHRELRFNLSAKPDEVIANAPETSDFVLVQGVIDCFTENNDGTYTVIDFKTDNVKAENAADILTERYKNQLAFYCKAVEDITGKNVSRAVIFSFASMEEIELDVKNLKFGQ